MYAFKIRKWFVVKDFKAFVTSSLAKPDGEVVVNITGVDFLVMNKNTGSKTTYKNTRDGKNLILYQDGVKQWSTDWNAESLVYDGLWEVLWCSFDNSFTKNYQKTLEEDKNKLGQLVIKKRFFFF